MAAGGSGGCMLVEKVHVHLTAASTSDYLEEQQGRWSIDGRGGAPRAWHPRNMIRKRKQVERKDHLMDCPLCSCSASCKSRRLGLSPTQLYSVLRLNGGACVSRKMIKDIDAPREGKDKADGREGGVGVATVLVQERQLDGVQRDSGQGTRTSSTAGSRPYAALASTLCPPTQLISTNRSGRGR